MLKLNWGFGIAALYSGFVALIIFLVYGSMRQHFDLVSPDYYAKELAYEKTLDAARNQTQLSAPVTVFANEQSVFISFPAELKGTPLSGRVDFYSPVDSRWDKQFRLATADDRLVIPRSQLQHSRYTVKISFTSGGKDYYQEKTIDLSE